MKGSVKRGNRNFWKCLILKNTRITIIFQFKKTQEPIIFLFFICTRTIEEEHEHTNRNIEKSKVRLGGGGGLATCNLAT